MEDVNHIMYELLMIQYVMEYMILMLTMCIFPRDVLEALSTSWDYLLS